MPRKLECECGYVAEGQDDELVVMAQDHARAVHRIELDRKRILRLATSIAPDTAAETPDLGCLPTDQSAR
ncbi:MAG: hypothetical protein ACYDH5_12390 [Acidimicrobiales bacterium]